MFENLRVSGYFEPQHGKCERLATPQFGDVTATAMSTSSSSENANELDHGERPGASEMSLWITELASVILF